MRIGVTVHHVLRRDRIGFSPVDVRSRTDIASFVCVPESRIRQAVVLAAGRGGRLVAGYRRRAGEFDGEA